MTGKALRPTLRIGNGSSPSSLTQELERNARFEARSFPVQAFPSGGMLRDEFPRPSAPGFHHLRLSIPNGARYCFPSKRLLFNIAGTLAFNTTIALVVVSNIELMI